MTKLLIRMHLGMCRHCQRYMRQMEIIVEAVRSKNKTSVDPDSLPAFKKKILEHLKKF